MDPIISARPARRRGWRAAPLVLALSLLAAACGGSDTEGGSGEAGGGSSGKKEGGSAATGEGLPGDTLVDYQTLSADNPNHIDPATADTRQGSQVTEVLYDGLTQVDADNEVVAGVASEWEPNDDATEWTFTLSEDEFSDGEPVLPSTFKASWERVLNPDLASTLSYHLLPIAGATALNEGEADELSGVEANDEDMTLTVTLESPLSDFPAIVSHTVFSPLPKAATDATTGDEINEWERGLMIGNGPYKMSEPWADDEYIKVEANEAYRGDAPAIPKIDFMISKEVEASFNAFESGEADTAYIPAGGFADATSNYNNSTEPTFGLYYFAINWEDEDLGGPDNLAVRQAMSLAIDRERINEQVYDGAREVATGVTPPGIPGYTEDLCGGYCTYDPDRAEQLIEEWGKAGSMEPIKLQFNLGGDHEDLVSIVEENLKAVGLKVEQDPRDGETYFDEMKKPDQCSVCRAGWIWDYPSYYNAMNALFTTTSIGGDNLARYSSETYDELAGEAAATADEDERSGLWNDAEEQLFADMAVIPINWYTNQIVYSDRVENLVANGLQAVNYPDLELTD